MKYLAIFIVYICAYMFVDALDKEAINESNKIATFKYLNK